MSTDTTSKGHYKLARLQDIDVKYIQALADNVRCNSPRRPLIVRLLWILSVSAMIGFCALLGVRLIGDYAAKPSYNTLQKFQVKTLTLPALTICNLNAFNKTSMQARIPYPKTSNKTLYDIWKEATIMYEDTDTEISETIKAEAKELDSEHIYSNYAFDIMFMSVLNATRFSKRAINFTDHGSAKETELGRCWEINDESSLNQWTAGPIGGLEMILDTSSSDYVDATESVGFSITLKMPNETVLNKEFAVFAAAGQRTMINLKYTNLTRLPAPYGTCQDSPSYFNPDRDLSSKECFLSNTILWSFLNTTGCRCLPWYFANRYATSDEMNSAQMAQFGTTVVDRLAKYWTSPLTPGQYKLNITTNNTCRSTVYNEKEWYEGGDWLYTGKYLQTVPNTADYQNCSTLCYKKKNCVCFMFLKSNATNLGNAGDCILMDGTAKDTRGNITGLISGRVNCTEELETCGFSAYASCVNTVVKERESGSTAQACSEPCQYTEYTPSISSSAFPSKAWWEDNKENIPHYSTWQEAKDNLAKIVIYYSELELYTSDQTPSYELQSFIAELGGLTDLLMGFSFFGVFQLIEWFIGLLIGTLSKKKLSTKNGSVSPIEIKDDAAVELSDNIERSERKGTNFFLGFLG